jgi:hypothetical protein
MCDETIFRILNSHYPHLKNAFNFTRKGLNRVLSAKAGPCTVQNPHAIYIAQFKLIAHTLVIGGRYSIISDRIPITMSPQMIQCLFLILLINLLCQISCRETASVLAVTCPMWFGVGGGRGRRGGGDGERGGGMARTPGRARGAKSKLAPNANEITPARGAGAASAITPGNDDGQVNDVGGEVGCQLVSVVGSNFGSSLPLYWDSPEAAKLFGFSYQDGDDVHKGVQDIVTSLTRVQQSHDGYKHFVANIYRAPLTPIQIFCLKSQCLYLWTAYQIALKKLGRVNNTWIETCCEGAVRKLSPLGFNVTVDKKRLGLWNRLFQRDHIFPHPNSYVANGMKPKPRIFEVLPEAEAMISDFVLSHLDHFSVAMLRNELITIIIPGLKQKAEDESVPVDSEEYLFLSHLSMQPPSYSTVLRWLHYLGYTHDKLKKSYYVDGHEHQEQKLDSSRNTLN